jgi:hypothetical protein
LANFSARSIQTLTARINEFKTYLKSQKIRSIKKVDLWNICPSFPVVNSSGNLEVKYFKEGSKYGKVKHL